MVNFFDNFFILIGSLVAITGTLVISYLLTRLVSAAYFRSKLFYELSKKGG